jgi:hypothetical protein
MFNIFSKNKPPNKPNEALIHEIKLELDQMVNHLNNAFRLFGGSNPNIMDLEIIDARKRFRQINLEIQAGKMCFHNVVDIWPDGKQVFIEISKFFENMSLFFDNFLKWCELIHSPSFDIYNTSHQNAYQNHVLNSRKYSSKTDFHYNKAIELLRKFTGIELLPLG